MNDELAADKRGKFKEAALGTKLSNRFGCRVYAA